MKRSLPAYVYPKGKKGYLYFCRHGKVTRMHSRPGTEDFASEYALLMRGRQPTPARTVRQLIIKYQASDEWKALAPNTQKSYRRHLAFFEKNMGHLDPKSIKTPHIKDMRDALKDTPTTASRAVGAVKSLFKYAIGEGWIEKNMNPATDVAMLPGTRDPREPWPPRLILAFRQKADPLSLLIFEILIGTGQRISDVLKMKWADVKEAGITVEQGKRNPVTKKRKTVWIPFTPRLARFLSTTPHLGETIVAQRDPPFVGQPVSYSKAAADLLRIRKQIGAEAWDQHALRHTAASDIASLPGMTFDHVAAITGHNSKEIASLYAGRAMQKARAKEAQAARGTEAGQDGNAEMGVETESDEPTK